MRSPARSGDGMWTAAIVAVTVVAAILRWINLGGGLWVDEMYSLVESFRIPFGTLLTTFTGDTQHPLYSALANRAVTWLGESNRVIRLPAFLAGVATVPAVYVLGRRWVSRGEALAAALLLAVSYHHVWFSQNARGYTMIALATVLSTHLLLRILEQGRPRDVLAYAVVVGLGAYTHLTMVFAAFGHALVLAGLQLVPDSAGRRFRTWRLPALALVGSAVVTVLLYAPMLDDVLNFFLNRPSRLRGISTPAWAVAELGRVLSTGVGAGPGLLAGAALFFVGVASYARKSPLACALFVVPGFVTILGALAARGTMYPRFFFFLVGFAFLILARGVFATSAWVAARLVSDPERARVRSGQGAAVAVALIALVFVRSLGYNYAYPKQDWVGTAAWVDANVPADEPIVTAGVSVWPFEHYLPRPWQAIPDGEDARVSALRAQGPVWVVYVFPRYLESTHPDLARQVESECEARQQFDGTLGSGDIYACRLPPRPQT
ncbi:MAG: glycosyltransferase family 39 protein [Gemmatimonadota bacterium]|nr:glycosyltransferase family 39 protein [Gemmatimonadota bacterium]